MALPGTFSDGQNVAVKDKRPQLPPEERFWKRYSPHHECSLSSAVSVILHVAFVGVLLLVAALVAKLGLRERNNPVAIDAVALAPGNGGDDQEEGASKGTPDSPKEDVATPKPQQQPAAPVPNTPELTAPKAESPKIPEPSRPDTMRFIDESKQASDAIQKMVQEAMKEPPLTQEVPKARGKPDGTGKGVQGSGPGSGRSGSIVQQRIRRRARWHIMLRTHGPEDHVGQFAALGVILAFPTGGGQFYVVRDLLGRPPRGKIEDISKIFKFYAIDQDPGSARDLARFLHAPLGATFFLAFFPNELENAMAEMEKTYRGRREEELTENTYFKVVPSGGSYVVVIDENPLAR
jgi:hypothetical protein